MTCPHCLDELSIAERKGIEIDYCPTCRGVWLDRGELDKIIERTIAETSRPRDRQYNSSDRHSHKKRKRHKASHFIEEVFDIFD